MAAPRDLAASIWPGGNGPLGVAVPDPALSVTKIARVAIQIADADGLESLTMKKVAEELGVTTMALYRYFPAKADLIRLMIDSTGEPAPPFRNSSLPGTSA